MNRTSATTIAFLLTVATNVASAAVVGPAADYGVFIFGSGSFNSQNTDTEGNLAAGGNVSLTNYSVASSIAGNPATNPNPARLVVGGNLNATNGGVGNGQNGALYVGGTSSLTSFTATGGLFAQTLVDFAAAETLYKGLSSSWGTLVANGSASISFGSLTLSGSDPTLNVFSLSANDLNSTNTVNINLAAPGSTVLINVTGSAATFQNGQVFLNNVASSHIFYNFIDATSVNLAGSKNPMGSILAPFAGVTGGFGAMDGQLIAGSYSGNTEFHLVPFTGNITAVPLPAAVWLLASALAGLVRLRRRAA